jgi:hypothetical protein
MNSTTLRMKMLSPKVASRAIRPGIAQHRPDDQPEGEQTDEK